MKPVLNYAIRFYTGFIFCTYRGSEKARWNKLHALQGVLAS